MLFYPYLQGAGPDLPGACGAFLGLYGSSDSASMWRAILEAIAFEYARMVQIYRECGMPLKEIIGTEGGSKSPLWTQIKADVLGAAYSVPTRGEGGLMADAAVAAYGVGDIDDLRNTMRKWVTFRGRFESDERAHLVYRDVFRERTAMLEGGLNRVFAGLERIRGILGC